MHEQWKACLESTRSKLTAEIYDTWIRPIRLKSFANNELLIVVPNKEFINPFATAVGREFGAAIQAHFGLQCVVRWEFAPASLFPLTNEERWAACLLHTQQHSEKKDYEVWIPHIVLKSFNNNELLLQVPTKIFVETMPDVLKLALWRGIQQHFGEQVKLKFEVKTEEVLNQNAGRAFTTATPPSIASGTSPVVSQPTAPKVDKLDSKLLFHYDFENFCAGTSNSVALNMAKSIAAHPEQNTFNPFFLYGPPGVGKTHLVNAVGLEVQKNHPDWRILFVSGAVFQTQYTTATTNKNSDLNNFIYFYQSIDLLIIDDFQAITGPKTLGAFFHIFNHLHQNGRKILVTCDRPPSAIEGLEERMLSRLKWGVVAELERPDIGLRKAILEAKLRKDGIDFPQEVVNYIAEQVTDNVRELQGTINSMIAFVVVDNCELDLQLAKRIIPRLVNQSRKELSFEILQQQVCQHCRIKVSELHSKSRKKNIAGARQLLMYLTHKYTQLSLTQIGYELGGREHSTVKHACTQVERRLSMDKQYRQEIEALEASLK